MYAKACQCASCDLSTPSPLLPHPLRCVRHVLETSCSPPLAPERFARQCRALEGMRFDIPKSIDLRPTRTLLDWLPLMGEEKGL